MRFHRPWKSIWSPRKISDHCFRAIEWPPGCEVYQRGMLTERRQVPIRSQDTNAAAALSSLQVCCASPCCTSPAHMVRIHASLQVMSDVCSGSHYYHALAVADLLEQHSAHTPPLYVHCRSHYHRTLAGESQLLQRSADAPPSLPMQQHSSSRFRDSRFLEHKSYSTCLLSPP